MPMDEFLLEFIKIAWGILSSSIVVGYYFHRKSIKEPIAVYSIRSTNIFDLGSKTGIGEKITMVYEEQPIRRLSVSVVKLWNGGNSVLDGSALIQRDPLRISFTNDVTILEATIVTDTNPNCGCKTTTKSNAFPNSVLLDFEFLDRQDGVAARILHTGDSDSLTFAGALKGVRLENEKTIDKKYSFIGKVVDYTFYPIVVLAIIFGVLVLVMAFI